MPSVKALAWYCQLSRASELILVSPGDEFLSAVLPLNRVRYLFLTGEGRPDRRALDLGHLGVVVTVDEFPRLPELGPVFSARLREWNQEAGTPIATAIVARSEGEIRDLIQRSPERDFLVPASMTSSAHEIVAAPPSRLFLLSRGGTRLAQQGGGCGL